MDPQVQAPSPEEMKLSIRTDEGGQQDLLTTGVVGLIGVLVMVLVAASIYPTMLNQTEGFELTGNLSDPDNNTTPGRDLSAANRALVAVFDTLAIVAYVLLPLAIIFLVIHIARKRRE